MPSRLIRDPTQVSVVDTLAFVITSKCNAQCSFCCNESGPHRATELDPNTLDRLVCEGHALGMRQIAITGGEPMMRPAHVRVIAERCSSLGVPFSITTNGFWGGEITSARKTIATLMKLGLRRINLSVDEEHLRWVKKTSIINVIVISKEYALDVHIQSAYYADGKRLDQLFDPSLLDGLVVSEAPVQFAGRAEYQVSNEIPRFGDLPHERCLDELQITVNFDGYVYPCCSTSGFTEGLRLGNIYQEGLNDCINRAERSQYLQYIQKKGLSDLADQLFPNSSWLGATNVCELCRRVTCNQLQMQHTDRIVGVEVGRLLAERLTEIACEASDY